MTVKAASHFVSVVREQTGMNAGAQLLSPSCSCSHSEVFLPGSDLSGNTLPDIPRGVSPGDSDIL